ncbi:MAG TPA: CYTH domain-containing protein [Candidatus Paceibacterota bacterium]
MSKSVEIEARWINLDPATIEKKLTAIGATKEGSYFFQEWVFAHPEWRNGNRRLRVRSDGTQTWLTYKANATWAVDSTEEVEVTVSSAAETAALVGKIGIPLIRHQEKKRDTWKLGDIVFDLDYWPKIPMVFEIEGPSEEKVRDGARLLGLDWKDAIFEDQLWVHKKYYDIDLFAVNEYCFPKE